MFALVDCNSFYCSVEKVFHPGLKNKPVCVLSSNDGCIVALTPEAKAIGLRRGDPLFKVEHLVKQHGVAVFSGNMQLYAAMSKRITHILRQAVSDVDVYSIDECFCDLRGYERFHDLTDYMTSVVKKIKLYTDIPVSVGIASSKTLAKMGSKFAKKYKGYHGVCLIDTEEKRRKALALTELSDVWGIGRATLAKLHERGVCTALAFADMSERRVKSMFHLPGYQTWLELNGIPCIQTREVLMNKTVCTSRSFGSMISDLTSLKASVATFASSCANKLRGQCAGAKAVTVFLCSNRFRSDLEQYASSETIKLGIPTSDTLEITQVALKALAQIYRPGIMYKKSGVILSDICDLSIIQPDLFDTIRNRQERMNLMKAVDALNRRYGVKTIRLSVEGDHKQAWKVKCDHRSPNYLTDINELLTLPCR